MRRRLLLLCLLACLVFPKLNAQRLEYEALFLGNSYTYVNDLPGLIRQLAIAGGDTLSHDQNTPGGYTLSGHSTNATSLNKINARNWDFVILQEQSQLPSFSPVQVSNQVLPFAAQLNNAIKANDSCTETVFYMTWGRKHGDASNCGNYPPVCTYAGMQARLRSSYLLMAQNNDATVAPCGVAWWETILRDSTIELYSADQSHPSYAGSYLNACVFYATLYRKSPLGLNFFGSLDSLSATFLQEVAHDVVFDSLEQWRIGHADVLAGFGYGVSPNGWTQFTDSSNNATWWQWDFGDGSVDSVASPQHQFSQSGSYVVQQIVGNGCATDTLVDTIQVVLVGKEISQGLSLSVSPNPSAGILQLKVEFPELETLKIKVYDPQGRVIFSDVRASQGSVFHAEIDLGKAAAGLCLLEIETAGKKVVRRLWIRN